MDRKKGEQLFPRALYFGIWTEKRGLDDYFQNLYTLGHEQKEKKGGKLEHNNGCKICHF